MVPSRNPSLHVPVLPDAVAPRGYKGVSLFPHVEPDPEQKRQGAQGLAADRTIRDHGPGDVSQPRIPDVRTGAPLGEAGGRTQPGGYSISSSTATEAATKLRGLTTMRKSKLLEEAMVYGIRADQ